MYNASNDPYPFQHQGTSIGDAQMLRAIQRQAEEQAKYQAQKSLAMDVPPRVPVMGLAHGNRNRLEDINGLAYTILDSIQGPRPCGTSEPVPARQGLEGILEDTQASLGNLHDTLARIATALGL